MQRRSNFLTFMSSLVPGLGYMYLGLMKKGIQAMVIFFLIDPLFKFIGLSWLVGIILTPLWFYLFFDTFHIAHKLDRGENVRDSDLIFIKYHNLSKMENINDDTVRNMRDKGGLIIGSALVVIGVLSIINKLFYDNAIYDFIKQSVGTYFVPVIFVLVGVYILIKKK